eukprot:TRINITY_DN5224_c0_g1_i6.p1 TRINITY_DN5224_c0_g1~~TRINITY_DN5224_c0_g1_i6.p1  ORF type:complete len:249 (-),score=61.84 TRINITY_DN5224_c0_g1_i6:342-1010(-)
MTLAEPVPPPMPPNSLYSLLGVSEDAKQDDIVKAYRQKALKEHPDKGGDVNSFDDLNKAYGILCDDKQRSSYDDELARQREKAQLVEGGRQNVSGTSAGYVSRKQAQAPMPPVREKTAPTPGSKRQCAFKVAQPGKPQHCADEWKGMGSGAGILKMITDDVTPKEKTERLLEQYSKLPRGKEKKREWVSGLRGKEKFDLKAAAKKREEKERQKWAGWIAKSK